MNHSSGDEMNVGDLVRYSESEPRGRPLNPRDELGIITETGVRSTTGKPECHVVWFTCANEGWWNRESLEVLSENR